MKRQIIFLILGVLCATPSWGASPDISLWTSGEYPSQGKTLIIDTSRIDFSLLTLEENISIPDVKKQSRRIREAQYKEMKRLKKAKLANLELIRNKEVIKATISASSIFSSNDTTLNDRADLYLRPFLQNLRIPEYYHMLLVMHSDNTGSEEYLMDLTRYRVNAVKEWFRRNGGHIDFVITYEAGDLTPIDTNNTMEGRARNRRLEIYLVPGQKMFEMAKEGKLDK